MGFQNQNTKAAYNRVDSPDDLNPSPLFGQLFLIFSCTNYAPNGQCQLLQRKKVQKHPMVFDDRDPLILQYFRNHLKFVCF
jgi:hypothetical protein